MVLETGESTSCHGPLPCPLNTCVPVSHTVKANLFPWAGVVRTLVPLTGPYPQDLTTSPECSLVLLSPQKLGFHMGHKFLKHTISLC